MLPSHKDTADILTGALLILAAVFFGVQTAGLEIGTSLRMGPGYFPMVLSGLLFVLGAVILFKALRTPGGEPFGTIAWHGMLFILLAPVFFGLTVRGLGFVPSLFVTALIAAQASVRMTPLASVVLAALVTLISTLVFSYALGLPFQRFGPWLPF